MNTHLLSTQAHVNTNRPYSRLTRVVWAAIAVLIPGGIVVLAVLALIRLAGRRALPNPDESRRAA